MAVWVVFGPFSLPFAVLFYIGGVNLIIRAAENKQRFICSSFAVLLLMLGTLAMIVAWEYLSLLGSTR